MFSGSKFPRLWELWERGRSVYIHTPYGVQSTVQYIHIIRLYELFCYLVMTLGTHALGEAWDWGGRLGTRGK